MLPTRQWDNQIEDNATNQTDSQSEDNATNQHHRKALLTAHIMDVNNRWQREV